VEVHGEESQVCELVESDPLGENGKVGLRNKLLAKAKVCCCTMVWCGERDSTVLLRLSNDGVSYMFRNDMIIYISAFCSFGNA
jgi:hypothetical protein